MGDEYYISLRSAVNHERSDVITNAVSILEEARNEGNWAPFFSAGPGFLIKYVIGPWNDYSEMLYESFLNTEGGESLKTIVDAARVTCKLFAAYATRPYDVQYQCLVEKTRQVVVEVPKERKVGLFRKERYIDHEERTEQYKEAETVCYQGWFIERLHVHFSHETFNPYEETTETLYVDYCLGADGEIYMIVHDDSEQWAPLVLECSSATPMFLANKTFNVFVQAISGTIGALDCIPQGGLSSDLVLEESGPAFRKHYSLNFPAQIDDPSSLPYGTCTGIVNRLLQANLFNEDAKRKLLEEFPSYSPFFE